MIPEVGIVWAIATKMIADARHVLMIFSATSIAIGLMMTALFPLATYDSTRVFALPWASGFLAVIQDFEITAFYDETDEARNTSLWAAPLVMYLYVFFTSVRAAPLWTRPTHVNLTFLRVTALLAHGRPRVVRACRFSSSI